MYSSDIIVTSIKETDIKRVPPADGHYSMPIYILYKLPRATDLYANITHIIINKSMFKPHLSARNKIWQF